MAHLLVDAGGVSAIGVLVQVRVLSLDKVSGWLWRLLHSKLHFVEAVGETEAAWSLFMVIAVHMVERRSAEEWVYLVVSHHSADHGVFLSLGCPLVHLDE